MRRELVTVGPFISDRLYAELADRRPDGLRLYEYYSRVMETYADAWDARDVPRAFIGMGQTRQRSMQIDKDVLSRIEAIAESERVSVATVLRTACAYFVHRSQTFDPYESHRLAQTPADSETKEARSA